MTNIAVNLPSPIQAHGETVTEVELSEPIRVDGECITVLRFRKVTSLEGSDSRRPASFCNRSRERMQPSCISMPP